MARVSEEASAAFGRLRVETSTMALKRSSMISAAFGRLRVETSSVLQAFLVGHQPPSGGCVLKPLNRTKDGAFLIQPPSGGCVLKHKGVTTRGGGFQLSAAFGRLRVETLLCV